MMRLERPRFELRAREFCGEYIFHSLAILTTFSLPSQDQSPGPDTGKKVAGSAVNVLVIKMPEQTLSVSIKDSQGTLVGVDGRFLQRQIDKAMTMTSDVIRCLSNRRQEELLKALCSALQMCEKLSEFAQTSTRQVLSLVTKHKLWEVRGQSKDEFLMLPEESVLALVRKEP